MTRAEIALERHRRHSAAVLARRDRAIAQAPDEMEAMRRLQRRAAYARQAGAELRHLLARIEAHHEHLRAVKNRARRRATNEEWRTY